MIIQTPEPTTTDLVMDLIAKALKGKTMCGTNIFQPRDWPTMAADLPRLIINCPEERKESQGPNAPAYEVEATIRIVGTVRTKALPNDQGAMAAQGMLGLLQRQIERAVINDYALYRVISEIRSVDSKSDTTAEGEKTVGQLTMDLTPRFYQGTEAFAPIDGTPFDQIALWGDLYDVADRSGTYSPPFDYPVVPAPRDHGPDGRVEISGQANLNPPET